MQKLHRSRLISGSMMSGYYRYSDVFQILPSRKDSSVVRKYIDIEYNSRYSQAINGKVENAGTDSEDRIKSRSHLNFLKELIALLSIVTNDNYELDFAKEQTIRPIPQETIHEFSSTSLPEVRRDPHRVRQRQNSCASFVSIHTDADAYFRNYFRLTPDARSKYNASIFLYQTMRKIVLTSASMGIIGLISSIENLVDFDSKRAGKKPGHCRTCNQPVYSISKRFKEFMEQFSEFDIENSNKLLGQFYSQRSSIVHAGEILEIDRLLSDFSMNELREFTEIESHVRIALYNYLLKYEFDDENIVDQNS